MTVLTKPTPVRAPSDSRSEPEKQTRASQANGAKSRGPRTPDGKSRSARNSTRHGLLAKTIVLEEEDEESFHALHAGLMQEFDPQTPAETLQVEAMVAATWRQLRAMALQKTALDREIALQGPELGNSGNSGTKFGEIRGQATLSLIS
jgi:hypothetical protein